MIVGTAERNENIRKLRDLIKDIRIAMLTTMDDDGFLRSRPMATQETDFDGDLWFFTRDDAAKIDEVRREQRVSVGYARPDKNIYVSVSGNATFSRDRDKMEELWRPAYKFWFENGLDDPHLALMHIEVTHAEYWDVSNHRLANMINFVKGLATGERPAIGENEKLNLT